MSQLNSNTLFSPEGLRAVLLNTEAPATVDLRFFQRKRKRKRDLCCADKLMPLFGFVPDARYICKRNDTYTLAARRSFLFIFIYDTIGQESALGGWRAQLYRSFSSFGEDILMDILQSGSCR